jgi:hypothetical protein
VHGHAQATTPACLPSRHRGCRARLWRQCGSSRHADASDDPLKNPLRRRPRSPIEPSGPYRPPEPQQAGFSSSQQPRVHPRSAVHYPYGLSRRAVQYRYGQCTSPVVNNTRCRRLLRCTSGRRQAARGCFPSSRPWSALGPHGTRNRWSSVGTSGHGRRLRTAARGPSAAPTSAGGAAQGRVRALLWHEPSGLLTCTFAERDDRGATVGPAAPPAPGREGPPSGRGARPARRGPGARRCPG